MDDTISIKLNRELAAMARPVLRHYGIDIETALNIYLMQIITNSKPLFPESNVADVKYVRPPMQFDCLKGILVIDDDFGDVLADFQEYM